MKQTVSPPTFPSGIVVGATVEKTNASLCVFLRVETTNNKEQKYEFH